MTTAPSTTGEPLLHYKCLTPHRPDCDQEQTIHCSESYVMLLPLSRKTELYNAVRDYHLSQEHSIEHQRRRNMLCGKDETGRLFRWGVKAQRSRAQFALVLDWLRLGIRHGWIELAEGELHDGREREPIRPNRIQRRAYRSTTGLRERIEHRRASGLELPYGSTAIALGLAPPPGWLARGDPPADPPPE